MPIEWAIRSSALVLAAALLLKLLRVKDPAAALARVDRYSVRIIFNSRDHGGSSANAFVANSRIVDSSSAGNP